MCAVMYLMGFLYCTRMGIELLDIVDHYCITYYLLLEVTLEAFMFAEDFGWRHLVVHVKLATLGNLRTPLGQKVVPSFFWRLAIHFTMPSWYLFLFFYIFSTDVAEPYGGYPGWLQGIGWFCLAALLAVTPLGFARSLKLGTGSTLPALEQDEAASPQPWESRAPCHRWGKTRRAPYDCLDGGNHMNSDRSPLAGRNTKSVQQQQAIKC
ncbi:unnamed protein product [Polarella glacialis]|uniref:Uncharacterized protein n=1 Tax=Polarella glacialis TaxID=89957 RepID=A0A813H0C7_POLGL|nr:unnamed protein product [Polarella glacialis]